MTEETIKDNSVCEKCNQKAGELYMCEICEEMYCYNCRASYNQFSQIDFNCCDSCAKSRYSEAYH